MDLIEAILFPPWHVMFTSSFVHTIWQFQPVMVKKDQEEKSDKLVTNGSSNQKPDPVGAVESSSSAASPQASA